MRQLIVTPDLLADLRRYNAGIARAKRSYYGSPVNATTALAKATRKAAAQQRYRDKRKAS